MLMPSWQLYLELSTVGVDQIFRYRQAQPGATSCARCPRIDLIKRVEDFMLLMFGNADSVVDDGKRHRLFRDGEGRSSKRRAWVAFARDRQRLQLNVAAVLCELDRVLGQYRQRLLDAFCVHIHRGEIDASFGRQSDVLGFRAIGYLRGDLRDKVHGMHLRALQREIVRSKLSNIQKRVNHFQQFVGVVRMLRKKPKCSSRIDPAAS